MSSTSGAPTPRAAPPAAPSFYPKIKYVDITFNEQPTYQVHDYTTLMTQVYGVCFLFLDLLLPDGSNFRDTDQVIKDINKKIIKTIMDTIQIGTASKNIVEEIVVDCFTLMGTSDSNGIPRLIKNPNIFNRVLQVASKQQNNVDIAVN